jgi:hypothetical protein
MDDILAAFGLMPPAYTFFGPADYVSHTGERPIAFTWRLREPLQPALLQQAKLAMG